MTGIELILVSILSHLTLQMRKLRHSTASLRDAGSVLNETDGMGVPLNRQRDLCLRTAPCHTPGCLHTTHEGSQEGRWERAS